MLVSYNWLKEYVNLSNITPDELGEKFTLGGLEVETIQKLGENLENLVVGKVETCEPLEGSDHLNKTTVNIGNEVLPIICGAPNIAAGQKVVVAKVGAVLPGDFKIKKAKIMGETSEGMIVSLDELGFSDSIIPKKAEEGIYVLNKEAEIGADARPYVGLDDAVIEFDLTPNRADALSMRGVAYEVGALLDQVPSFDEIDLKEDDSEKVEDYISVSVESEEDTLDYRMRIVKDVEIGDSPLWMQHKLMHAGIRPIDLVVDITNYVMLEFGQPLHAFDYDKLESKQIHVRRADTGEELVTLDGQNRKLIHDNLVITNGQKAVALAGVMGGQNSQITEDTKTIAIESAVFNPVLTRRTANRLNLRSESSNRFEKGVNIATVQAAADLAAKLMVELGGGTIVKGTAKSSHTTSKDVSITTTVDRINGLIGSSLTEKDISSILDRLGFEHEIQNNSLEVSIPTRRWDIEIAEDLIEEIARIYGYNNIPVTLPVTESTPGELTTEQKTARLIRNVLEGNGMQEAVSYSLTLPEKAGRYAITKGHLVSLQNPMSKERVTLRQNIVSGLIDDATYNITHQVSDIALYEIGHVFYEERADEFIEYNHVGGLLTGKSPKDWFGQEEVIDFYTAKGLVETLLSSFLFSEEINYQLATDREGMHPGRTADIYIGKELVGYVGEIHPTIAKNSDLNATFVFELSIDKIVNAAKDEVSYKALNRYPGSSRDIALLVDQEVTHAELEAVISENGGQWLQNIRLFDLYEGDNIQAGKKSMAYSLYYANPKATLKEDEVNTDFNRVQEALVETFNVEIR